MSERWLYFRTKLNTRTPLIHIAGCPILNRAKRFWLWNWAEGVPPNELIELVLWEAPQHKFCRCVLDAAAKAAKQEEE